MAKIVKRRRGTTAEHVAFTGNEGEITVDLTLNTLRVHDGSTVGGTLLAKADMSNVSNAVGIDQIDASGEDMLLSLVESCSESGVEILFARMEGLDSILEKAGFKDRVGQNRFFQRRSEALRYAWEEIGDPEAEFNSPLGHLIVR